MKPGAVQFVPAAALVIAISQLPSMVGVEAAGRGAIDALAAVVRVGSWDFGALGLALLTIVAMMGVRRIHRLLPAVLLSVVIGMLVAAMTGFAGPIVGPLPTSAPTASMALPWGQLGQLLLPAVVIALVGFAEPAAIARNYAQQTRTRWNADREFVSQGVANVAAGLFGGFPVGGSFSRSAVAVQAGARSPWTGAFTGLLMLAALPVVGLLEALPLAVLGAVIFTSVLSLLNLRPIWELRRWSRQQLVIAMVTFMSTVAVAPQIHCAILIGVGLSVAAHLRREARLSVPAWQEGTTLHARPTGVLFFGSAHRLEDQLTDLLGQHPEVDHVVLHMQRLGRADVTGALALRDIVDDLASIDVPVEIRDTTPTSEKILDRVIGSHEFPSWVMRRWRSGAPHPRQLPPKLAVETLFG